MFSYQCRYCKINLDHWEKLVTHRNREHRNEFEALKSAFLQSRLGATSNHFFLESLKERLDELSPESVPLQSRMRPKGMTSVGKPKCAVQFPLTPRRTPSKALDADDLGDQEILLCVPTSSSARSLPTSSTILHSSSIPSTSSRTPFRNGGAYHSTNNDFLTPPSSPVSRSPSRAEEVRTSQLSNSKKGAVYYSKLNETEELQLYPTPTASSSSILVINHPASEGEWTTNGNGAVDEEDRLDLDEGILRRCANHVVIENLDDELQISCSSSNLTNGTREQNGQRFQVSARTADAQNIINGAEIQRKRLKRQQQPLLQNHPEGHLNHMNGDGDPGAGNKRSKKSSKVYKR